mgnify:CR=1 FL=1
MLRPSPPQLLSSGHNYAWLSWAPPPRGKRVSHYRVHQRAPGGSTLELTLETADASTYTRIDGLLAGGEYQFAVEAVQHGGARALSELGPSIMLGHAPDVLLVAGRLPLSAEEANLERHLEGMGLAVHAAAAHSLDPHTGSPEELLRPWSRGLKERSSAHAARLLIVTASCPVHLLKSWWLRAGEGEGMSAGAGAAVDMTPANGPGRLQRASWWLPALVLHPEGWPVLGMARATGLAKSAWIDLPLSAHPLTAALGAGRAPIYKRAGLMSHAATHPTAVVTGRTVGREGEAEAVVFGYERSGDRVHRMVGFGIGTDGIGELSADGRALLSAAVRWAMGAGAGELGAIPTRWRVVRQPDRNPP